ncbi:MAG: ribosome biogenesis GTP-binding protein YihA/YsxC, partial [Thioalkalivibrio sp.]|nr:ribosome biogenesis GTP-binding protein YihA/YsxC [Thioalkalivibrio sp.]
MARRPHTPGARKRPRGSARTPPPTYGRASPEPDAGDAPRLIASFETSAPDISRAPPDRGREIAFAGRSNAGKSSVLNRLAGQRGLARTSGTPGRTQLLNFFRIELPGDRTERPQATDDEGFEADSQMPRRLVDLPGYGYAKTNLQTRNAWQANVEEYLSARQTLVGVVLVMDIRHPFQPFDEHMVAWARASALPLLILLNKADKLGHGAASGALASARAHLVELPNV